MSVRWSIQNEKIGSAYIYIHIYHIYPIHILYTLRWWFHLGSAYLHIINQCWVTVNWTLTNKLQCNFDQKYKKFSFMKMHLKISSSKWRPCPGERWVNWPTLIPPLAWIFYLWICPPCPWCHHSHGGRTRLLTHGDKMATLQTLFSN